MTGRKHHCEIVPRRPNPKVGRDGRWCDKDLVDRCKGYKVVDEWLLDEWLDE